MFLVLIHLKHWHNYNPSLQLPCLPRYLSQISPWLLKSLFNAITVMLFISFPIFFLPHSTIRHHYLIYQTISQAIPIKYIINLYTNFNILLVKYYAYQKAEFFHSEVIFCSFIFTNLLEHTTIATTSIKNLFPSFSYLLSP